MSNNNDKTIVNEIFYRAVVTLNITKIENQKLNYILTKYNSTMIKEKLIEEE